MAGRIVWTAGGLAAASRRAARLLAMRGPGRQQATESYYR
jgi:hypothetical protein